MEEDIRRQVGRTIAVGADERQIFLYAGTETAARDAERIARDVLAQDGMVRRWKFLIAGASNEDDARELAGHIRRDAPPDATVTAEQPGVGWPFMPS